MKTIYVILVFLLMAAAFSSCSLSKSIESNQHIVAKNSIKIDGNEPLTKVEIEEYIVQPKTPKAFAFFYSNLYIYKKFSQKKDNLFNRWILKVFGDKPVIYNPAERNQSMRDIKTYLGNLGYFNAQVTSELEYKPLKVNITYKIIPGKPYLVQKNKWAITDTALTHSNVENGSLIKTGDKFNIYKLEDERDRITEVLRNNGFYEFNAEYVSFAVDSALQNHAVNLTTQINSKNSENPAVQNESFRKYLINKVFIYTNYEIDNLLPQPYDTLVLDMGLRKNVTSNGIYHFLYKNKMRLNPGTIAQSVFIEPDENFNNRDLSETYQKLNRIPLLKYIDISYKLTYDSLADKLDAHIKLFRSRAQFYSIETDGTHSSGDLGIRLGLNYGNKNIFKGGELLNVRISAAMENRQYTGYEETRKLLYFNTIEYGVQLSLFSPSFIVPLKQSRFPKYFKPQTYIRFGYNYQLRPSYERHLSNFNFGYEWRQQKSIFHRLNVLDISVIKIFPSEKFQAYLDSITNLRYKDQYQDHFIAAVKYDFVYNTQEFEKHESFLYINARIEAAGNLSYGLSNLFKATKTNDYYTMFGIRYAQYLRMEVDYRQFIALTNNQGFIYRLNMGWAIPYGNSLAMPFEKGFYGGGSNGMRGWAYRDLGPGTYNNALGKEYDKTGEIKLEANIEYRFPLYRYLKGAAFLDMGNIWLQHESETFPGGKFNWDSFYRQFALDGGLGFRLDFDFFILRVDGALKIQDPSQTTGNRFVLPKSQIKDIYWSFGIGYPF